MYFNKTLFGSILLLLSSNIYAQSDTVRSETVNIKVFRNSRSEGSLTSEIKSAGLVMNGISSERISSLQVSSANEVVRKITGVTVMDDGKLVIRGVSPRYNVVLLDGFKAPSFDPDVRLFSLDVLPANVLDNIKVFKSPAADNPSDFSGGIVNIETLSLPDKNEWRAQFTLGGDFQTLGSEFLSQDQKDGKMLGFNLNANDLPELIKEDHIDRSSFSVKDRISISNQLNNNFYPNSKNLYIPNWKIQLSRTNRVALNKNKAFFGSSHLFTFEDNYESRVWRRSSIMTNPFVARILNFSDQTYIQTNRTSILNNFTYGNTQGLRVDLKTLFVNNAEYGVLYRQGKALPGAYGENGVYEHISFKQTTSNNTFRRFLITSLNVKIPTNNERLDWSAGINYNLSYFIDQDRKSALQTRDDNPTGTTTTFNFKEDIVATMDQLRFGRWFYNLPENMKQIKTDFKYSVSKTLNLSTGFRYDITSRAFDLRSLGMVNGTLTDNTDTFSGRFLTEYTWPFNSYTASYSTTAAYVMANYQTRKMNINFGVRGEKSTFKLYSDGFESIFQTKNITRESMKLFPSLNATYNISKMYLVRGAVGYSSNRPELREYSPLEYLDIRNWLTAYGNGELEPISMILNSEIRFERYSKSGYFHVGAFHKKINNPVIAKSSGPNAFRFVNMHHAIVYGTEIEFSKSFKFSKQSIVNSIQFIGNISLNQSALYEDLLNNQERDSIVKLKKPMVGQSPYLFNLQISAYFKNNKGHVTLSGFYQGDRVVFTGDEVLFFSLVQRTGALLNLTSSYNLTKKSSLRLKIDNLLNASDLLYSDLNNNNKLDYYDGYISDTNGDSIFSHRRDPAVLSVSFITTF